MKKCVKISTNKMNYKSKNCDIDYISDLKPAEGEQLINKTIKKIEAREEDLRIYFVDGSYLNIEGHRYGGYSLGVTLNEE